MAEKSDRTIGSQLKVEPDGRFTVDGKPVNLHITDKGRRALEQPRSIKGIAHPEKRG